MTPIEKAKAHFKTQVTADLHGPVKVKEWDMEIYYRPTMSMSQQSQILELHQQNKLSEATVMLLIIRALDKDGQPLFKKSDKTELMRGVDSEVIGRVVAEISKHDEELMDDLGNE